MKREKRKKEHVNQQGNLKFLAEQIVCTIYTISIFMIFLNYMEPLFDQLEQVS